MEQQPLEQKVALVTGSSRGWGRDIAIHLAAAGATAIVNYHSNRERAEEVIQHITSRGGKAFAFQVDVASEKAVNNLFDNIRKVSQEGRHFGK
ncbi:short subunit dehydrogenase [Chitinophaga polysaccharea]|uniref:Short subunit dehydrogenase n=1 Tax=Chitinophaga polysaccharea TaxID=1293035 RepID=A0A561PPE6_9BACT|nr:SDR family NAD(P)-dependent oxidoreductase [Chitinophaga polysaccharea]TWF39978.1 short subunit dehydrogenase [Chitinophaga polysaccharea]